MVPCKMQENTVQFFPKKYSKGSNSWMQHAKCYNMELSLSILPIIGTTASYGGGLWAEVLSKQTNQNFKIRFIYNCNKASQTSEVL